MRYRQLLVASFLAVSGIANADVDVNIKYLHSQALEVSYQLPPACPSLAFKKKGSDAAKIRSTWQPLDACGKADGQHLSNEHAQQGQQAQQATCTQLRFQVPVSTNKVRGYPAAFPVADAIYVHTSNYAVETGCGKVSYSFSAPGIAMNAQVFADHARPSDVKGEDMPVLLLPQVVKTDGNFIGYFDPALGEANISNIRKIAAESIAFLHQALPRATFDMPIIAASRVVGPGGARPDGDAGDVLRLGLFNWPLQPDAETERMMTLFVSHEFSHRFQMRDATDAYADARLIHEGGAEFLRWLMAVRKGWLTHEQAADELNMALGECLLDVRQASWGNLTANQIAGGRLDYRCGLAVYVYGLAARQGKAGPFERFDGFYDQLRQVQGQTQAPRPDFAHALECGAEPACKSKWLPRLLGKQESMQAVWVDFFQQTGFARTVVASQQQKNAMLNQAMQELMREDCGTSSTFPQADKLGVDEVKGCKILRGGMNIIESENLPLYNHPDTLVATIAACRQRSQVRLSLESGQQLDLPCKKAYQPVEQFYAVDMMKLLSSLNH
ncbi:hypothetical protein ACO0K9_09190 [Undibacterium sp. Ji50W]|uniref:hypothetical protein n=1 Tax=Undibacterium sp. Ji50W TaxID=3413041 RepID=UPI003BF0E4AE